MGHTWEFYSDIWLPCTSWRILTFLLIILSTVGCEGKESDSHLVITRNDTLKRLPEGLLQNKTNLKKLVITKNSKLTELPELESLTKLEVLNVQQNALSQAPPVDHLRNLLQLTLAYNPIPNLPKNYLKSNINLTLFKRH